ncbi:MAG TPA: hypothetical protein VFT45_21985 [Longimicrobium sp.]|nr:hypothetical protein [Longimicrobium sp.]
MTRILTVLLVLLFSTDAAAQPVAGAFEVPMGDWEYRWVTRADGTGNVRREPATGYLRLHDTGRHEHQRVAEGTTMQTFGRYATEGYMLYLPHTDMDNGGRMAVDTFAVRHIGDRVFLFSEHGAETLEYTLAPPGAPEEPAVVPGLIPPIHAFVQSVMFFESDGGPMPRPQRRYATEFRADSVRYMNVEINLSHPITLEDGTLFVDCTFTHVETGEAFALEWDGQVRRGNASSGLSTGMGTAEPGAWPPGTYRVRCTVEGVEAPEAGFTIR